MLDYLLLAGSGFIAWIVSTIGGGGGALLLVPLVGFIAGSQAVAPVTTLATLIGGSGRAFVFWKDIHWPVAKWGLPGALVGGLLGAVLFTAAPAEWLQIVVGLYLVSAVLQYRLGRKERTFKVADWWFLPAEFVAALLDGLIGAVGPVMNTLYLNAGVTKERMAGTKTAILYDARCHGRRFVALRARGRSGRSRIELARQATAEEHARNALPRHRRKLHGSQRCTDDLAATRDHGGPFRLIKQAGPTFSFSRYWSLQDGRRRAVRAAPELEVSELQNPRNEITVPSFILSSAPEKKPRK
jgi:hypothetical protein